MTSDPKEKIKQLNLELDQAYVGSKINLEVFERMFADDLIFTSPNGLVTNRDQSLAFLKAGDVEYDAYDSTDVEVRVYNHTAVVTGIFTRKGRVKGKEVAGQFRYTRVYVQHQGEWQIVAIQNTSIAS
jgi:hypothetical protein